MSRSENIEEIKKWVNTEKEEGDVRKNLQNKLSQAAKKMRNESLEELIKLYLKFIEIRHTLSETLPPWKLNPGNVDDKN